MYCNTDISLQLSAACALSSPLLVMLLALLWCNLMLFSRMERFKSKKGSLLSTVETSQCGMLAVQLQTDISFYQYCEEMQKGSLYYSKPTVFG